mgnify:CR=1 FL=1
MDLFLKATVLSLLLGATFVMAEETVTVDPKPVNTSTTDDKVKKPDNTARNVRERSETEKTPVDQNENKADLEITRKIRRAIVEDKTLSTYAHNVKIITQDGMVELKGPVRSAEEKATIELKASDVAGKDKFKSRIEVAPKDVK